MILNIILKQVSVNKTIKIRLIVNTRKQTIIGITVNASIRPKYGDRCKEQWLEYQKRRKAESWLDT